MRVFGTKRSPGLCGLVLLLVSLVYAENECKPHTWRGSADVKRKSPPPETPQRIIRPRLAPGDVNCRVEEMTGPEVDRSFCDKMAERWNLSDERLLMLNPGLKADCSNLQPNTNYCFRGFIEPLRAYDGRCGPKHGNATCIGVLGKDGNPAQCCNSATWTCGQSGYDCSRGVCYEGICEGDKSWSTDGTCGLKFGNRFCAGRWGDCCSRDGRCGTGEEFCGKGCQWGNCTDWPERKEEL